MNPEEFNQMHIQQQIAESTLNPKPFEVQINDMVNATIEKHINSLDSIQALRLMQDIAKRAEEAIKETVKEDMLSYPKGYETTKVKIEVRNSAGRWSYKHIPEWNEAKAKLDAVEQRCKLAHKDPIGVFYNDEGIEIEPAEYKEGKETVFITLKK